jgi:hypothetical protein
MIAYANQEIKKKTFAKNQLLDIMHIEFKRRMRHGHTLYANAFNFPYPHYVFPFYQATEEKGKAN